MNYKTTALAAFMSKATKQDPSFEMAMDVIAKLDKEEVDERYGTFVIENSDALRHGALATLQSDTSEVKMDDAIRAVCDAMFEAKSLDGLYNDCIDVEEPVFVVFADTVGKKVKAVGQLNQDTWVTAYETDEFYVVSAYADMDGLCTLEDSGDGYTKTQLYKACNLSY